MSISGASIDVFISYKREEREIAKAIAEVLARRGYRLWWDAELLPGDTWRDAITAVIKQARAVVVLWSEKAVDSSFVRDEAARAHNSKKLIAVRLDGCETPLGFGEIQALDLDGWWPGADEGALEPLLKTLGQRIGAATVRPSAAPADNLHAWDQEAQFWRSVSERRPQTAKEYELYLANYPGGVFTDLARSRIEQLGSAIESSYLTPGHTDSLCSLVEQKLDLAELYGFIDEQRSPHLSKHPETEEPESLVVRRIVNYCREHPSRLAALIRYLMAIHDDPSALRQALRDALAPERRVTTPKRGGAIVVVCPPSLQSAGQELEAQLRERQAGGAVAWPRAVELLAQSGSSPSAPGNLQARLEASPLAIECVDNENRLPADIFAALLATTAKWTPYTLVCLSGYQGPPPSDDAVDLRDPTMREQGLRRLEADAGMETLPETTARSGSTTGIDSGDLADFARDATRRGLVLCVGADLVDAVQDLLPRDAMIATELLAELDLVRQRPTPHRVPLLPLAYAAILSRVVKGSDDPHDWRVEIARKLRQRGGRVATYAALGGMLRRLWSAGKERLSLVVVTTNVDLTLENAFIEADLPFTSVICGPDDKQPYQVRFPAKGSSGDDRIVLGDLEELVLPAGSKSRGDVLDYFREDGGISPIGEDEYVRRWRRNDLIGRQYEGLQFFHPAKLISLQGPLLVKILGSCHEGGDFWLSADELPRWRSSKLLPLVRGLVGKHAALVLGYSLADLPFLFLHETLFQAESRGLAKPGPLSRTRPLALVEKMVQGSRPCDAKARIIQTLLGPGLERRAREIGAKLIEVDGLSRALGCIGDEIAGRLEG